MDNKKPDPTPTMDELMRAALGRTPPPADEPEDDDEKPTMDDLLRAIVKGDE